MEHLCSYKNLKKGLEIMTNFDRILNYGIINDKKADK